MSALQSDQNLSDVDEPAISFGNIAPKAATTAALLVWTENTWTPRETVDDANPTTVLADGDYDSVLRMVDGVGQWVWVLRR